MEKEKSGRVRMLKEENNTQIEENTGLGLFDGGNTLEVRVKQKPKVQVSSQVRHLLQLMIWTPNWSP